MKPGDQVTWFRSVHPEGPVPATFVDQRGKRARITIIEKGVPRTLLVSPDAIERRRPPDTDARNFQFAAPGFRGGR